MFFIIWVLALTDKVGALRSKRMLYLRKALDLDQVPRLVGAIYTAAQLIIPSSLLVQLPGPRWVHFGHVFHRVLARGPDAAVHQQFPKQKR